MPRGKSKKLPQVDRIFVDADAFVALLDKKDPSHRPAKKLNNQIEKANYTAFTSNFAIGEAITVISQNASHKLAIAFGEKVFANEIFIIDVNRRHQIAALKKFSTQKSKNARFTDFVNMVLMDELGIETIFSFDKHYQKGGYKLLGD